MKKNSLVIIMFFTIIVLIVNWVNINYKCLNCVDAISHKFKKDSITISQLSGRIKMMYKNSSFVIQKEESLLMENGGSLKLKNIKFEKYLFVIRFSEFNCISCISQEMKHIARFLNSNTNIICLSTYSRQDDLVNSKRMMNVSFPIFNIAFETFDNEMERMKLPYYFIIDKNYQVSCLFVADPNNYQLTDDYLKFISTLIN